MNLNQITIGCTDLEKSIKFYSSLGLKLIVHSTDHYARFECPVGDATFSLHVCEQVQKNQTVIYFGLENLDEEVEKLKKKLKFEELPADQSWLWREAILYDPDGNKIKLYKAGVNRKDPPWKLK